MSKEKVVLNKHGIPTVVMKRINKNHPPLDGPILDDDYVRIHPDVRAEVIYRSGGRCHYCGLPVSKVRGNPGQKGGNIDHLIPKSRGGSNSIENLVVSCRICNDAKDDMTATEWRDAGYPGMRKA